MQLGRKLFENFKLTKIIKDFSRCILFGTSGGDHEHVISVQTFGTGPQYCLINGESINNSDITYLSSSISCCCTSIADSAFSLGVSHNFECVKLPTVTDIGDEAFIGCLIQKLEIPNVSSIGSYAFNYCTCDMGGGSLSNLEKLEKSTLFQSNGAFQGAELHNMNGYFPKLSSFGDAFYDCIVFPSLNAPNVLTIDDQAFYNSGQEERRVDISVDYIQKIGRSAFCYNCENATRLNHLYMRKVIQPPQIEYDSLIYDEGGWSSPHITCHIPYGMTTQFINATNWSSLYGSGVICFEEVDGTVHFGSNGSDHEHRMAITELSGDIDFSEGERQIGVQYCLSGDTVENGNITYLSSNEFCTLTAIGRYAFGSVGCPSYICLPTVKTIEWGAFIYGRGQSTMIFDNVETLQSSMFDACYNMTVTITLPSIKNISEYSFAYMGGSSSSLSVILNNPKFVVPLINVNAFDQTEDYTVYVPSSLYNDYIVATNWTQISDHIDIIQ